MTALFDRFILLEENFDPTFSASEDGELCYRLRRRGYRLGISRAICYHRHRATFGAFAHQRFWYGQGTWKFFRKHKNADMLLTALAFGPLGALWVIAKGKPILAPYLLAHSVFFAAGVISAAFSFSSNDSRHSKP